MAAASDLSHLEPAATRDRPSPVARAVVTVCVALLTSLFLLFILAPVAGLVISGGARGVTALSGDAELRAALPLPAGCATAATILGVLGGTPLAYLLARRRFRGRAIIAALMDLPLV